MGLREKLFVEVKRGTKVTLSENDLKKMDRMYERELSDIGMRKVLTPYRKEPQRAFLAQLRDYAFEKILDRHLYTFSHVLVIPNPYGLAKQTALILFNSSKEYKVRYRVLGDHGNDFVGESEYTKRHRIAILGLYLERSNKVDLSLIDREGNVVKHRLIRIYVSEGPKNVQNLLLGVKGKEEATFPLLAVNGALFSPVVLDADGVIRYSMQIRTFKMGMLPMSNGHVLLADHTANIASSMGKVQTCCYHEMDYMGRVYRTYVLSDPIGTAIAQHENSLFLVTTSDGEHYDDCIIELNMDTGEIVKRLNLLALLGEKYYQGKEWLLLSAMEYRDGKLLLTLKKIHTIAQVDWESGKLEWVLAPQAIWKDTPLADIALQPKGEELMLGRPDSATWINEEEMLIYSTGSKGEVDGGYDNPKESAVLRVKIDGKMLTYEQIESHSCLKTMRYGSALYIQNMDKYLHMTGATTDYSEDKYSQIVLLDAKTGETEKTIELARKFLWVWEFKPDIPSLCRGMDVCEETLYGNLPTPPEFHGNMPEESEERIRRVILSDVHLCDNLFKFSLYPGIVEKIFFKGEDKTYVQDYSHLPMGKRKEIFAVQVDGLEPGEYDIYAQINGKVHKMRNELRIMP
ncbi:MAG: aryl-sulfate sulfotransferase [Lachnospiraceae bacterium]|nr:aryl-sulfate sulfotransferase [Lachnospiraceae bacterium]